MAAVTTEPDLCASCGNVFPADQVCDGCKPGAAIRRRVLAWLGQLATYTLAWTIALWVTHLLGVSWLR